MALKKQYLEVPLHGGLDTKTDPKQVDAGLTLQCDNLVYATEKSLRKRYGSVEVTPPANTRWIASTEKELLAGTDTSLYSIDMVGRQLLREGTLSAAQYESTPIWGLNRQLAPEGVSAAYYGDFAFVAWTNRYHSNSSYSASYSSYVSTYFGIFNLMSRLWAAPPAALELPLDTFTTPFPVVDPKVVLDSNNSRLYVFCVGLDPSLFPPIQYQVMVYSAPVNLAETPFLTSAFSVPTGGIINMVASGAALDTYESHNGYDALIHSGSLYVAATDYVAGQIVLKKCTIDATGITAVAATTVIAGHTAARRLCLASNNTYLAVVSSSGAADFADATGAVDATMHVTGLASDPKQNSVACAFDGTAATSKLFCALSNGVSSNGGMTVATPVLEMTAMATPPTIRTNNDFGLPLTSCIARVIAGIYAVDGKAYLWTGAGAQLVTTTQWTDYLVEVTAASGAATSRIIGTALYLTAGEVGTDLNGTLNADSKGPAAGKGPAYMRGEELHHFLPRINEVVDYGVSPVRYAGDLLHVATDLDPEHDIRPVKSQHLLLTSSAWPSLYDGVAVAYAGFPSAPELPTPTSSGLVGLGLTPNSTYSWVACWVRRDAFGQYLRSAPGPAVTLTTPTGSVGYDASFTLPVALRAADSNVFLEIYRTLANGSEYYLEATLPSATSSYSSSFADTLIEDNPQLYISAGEIAHDPQPPATYLRSINDRMWAVSMEDPTRLYYSLPYRVGHPIEWSALQYIATDVSTGPIIGVAQLDEKVVVLKQEALYVFAGDGPDLTGVGSFAAPFRLPLSQGCAAPASILSTAEGVYYQSQRGIVRLNRALNLDYVGAYVEGYTETITSAQALPAQQHIRFMTASGRTLVYDPLASRWSTFSGQPTRSSTLFQGTLYYLLWDGSRIRQEVPGIYLDGVNTITFTVETPWVKLAGIQGWGRAYRMALLGQYRSDHKLQIQLQYDYSAGYTDTLTFSPSVGLISGDQVYQFRMSRLPRQTMQAIKVKLMDTSIIGESCDISTLVFEVGVKAGIAKLPSRKSV